MAASTLKAARAGASTRSPGQVSRWTSSRPSCSRARAGWATWPRSPGTWRPGRPRRCAGSRSATCRPPPVPRNLAPTGRPRTRRAWSAWTGTPARRWPTSGGQYGCRWPGRSAGTARPRTGRSRSWCRTRAGRPPRSGARASRGRAGPGPPSRTAGSSGCPRPAGTPGGYAAWTRSGASGRGAPSAPSRWPAGWHRRPPAGSAPATSTPPTPTCPTRTGCWPGRPAGCWSSGRGRPGAGCRPRA
jgi:hypothetical protein